MQRMQEKLLAKIEEVVTDESYEAAVAYDWPNRGHVYAQHDLDTVLAIAFDFQSEYCSIDLTGSAVPAAALIDSPPEFRVEASGTRVAFHMLKYIEGDRLKLMLETIRDLLPGR